MAYADKVLSGSLTVRECRQGEYIRLSNSDRVYIRRDYDRTTKKYFVQAFDDVSYWRLVPGDKVVRTGFTF